VGRVLTRYMMKRAYLIVLIGAQERTRTSTNCSTGT
jgi:hypothetical protein